MDKPSAFITKHYKVWIVVFLVLLFPAIYGNNHTKIYYNIADSFPSTLDEDGARCTVEVTDYRLNAVAVTAFLLDGPETLLRHIGLDERDTYTTKHEIDDLVTVVHITREEAPAWQH